MWLSRYICLFFIYSFMGWIYETLYCTIKNGKWENRGFLFGPACPIYGTGAVAISVIMKVAIGNGILLSLWQIFLIAFIGRIHHILGTGEAVSCGLVGLQ